MELTIMNMFACFASFMPHLRASGYLIVVKAIYNSIQQIYTNSAGRILNALTELRAGG
jgi:hypothetical protein